MGNLDFTVLKEYMPLFFEGIKFTIILSLLTVFFGVIFGTILCFMKRNKYLKYIASAYIELIRGTPLLLQIMIVYGGLPSFGIDLEPMPSVIIALAMNSAAYVAEIIRGGIEAVDKGQMEAARSLEMTQFQSMKLIIMPQAVKNILPAVGNEFVAVIKESSMASTIGVAELMYSANVVSAAQWSMFEPLLCAAGFYFILTFSLGRLMSYLERRMKASDIH